MLWFFPYRFDYPDPPRYAGPRLVQALEQQGLQCTLSAETLKIARPLGAFFRNSWNPVFVARLVREGTRTRLQGHFRVHASVLLFCAVFLGMVLWRLWMAYQQPELQPGFEPGWRAERIRFELQFLAMFVAINALGWLAGLPNARRILAALHASATEPAPPAS